MRKRKASDDADNGKTVQSEPKIGIDFRTNMTQHEPACRDAVDRRFRALYLKPSDFKTLARLDPDFAAVAKGREIDFCDPRAVMQLTKTLLSLDFGIKIDLPDDRLCPPVPNRHNYILWLKDLLDTSSYNVPGQKLTGLDIGTGASCIYPLLGCTQRPWSFIATDIDDKSLKWAQKNVQLNDLEGRIRVVSRTSDSPLIPLDDLGLDSINFTMTNPPFYESEEELLSSAQKKQRPPYTACTGSKTEMVTSGGELEFVNRIYRESLSLRERVQWYTAMFGFLSNLTDFIGKLQDEGIDNYAVTELVQGKKTRRWVVGWSFQALRPAQSVARGTKAAMSKSILPRMTEADVLSVDVPGNIGSFVSAIITAIEALDLISWHWDREAYQGIGRAADKVWARAWRRKQKREQEDKRDSRQDIFSAGAVEPQCMFGFKMWLRVSPKQVSVGCRWLEGVDAAAFESFQGFLKSVAKQAANMP